MSYEQLAAAVDALAVSNSNLTTRATESVDASNAAVSTAVAARDVAIQARDAAQLSAGIFDNTTLGLAATTNGKYFSTPSPESTEFLILYKNVTGVAVNLNSYPSTLAVKAIAFNRPLSDAEILTVEAMLLEKTLA